MKTFEFRHDFFGKLIFSNHENCYRYFRVLIFLEYLNWCSLYKTNEASYGLCGIVRRRDRPIDACRSWGTRVVVGSREVSGSCSYTCHFHRTRSSSHSEYLPSLRVLEAWLNRKSTLEASLTRTWGPSPLISTPTSADSWQTYLRLPVKTWCHLKN